MAPKPSNTQAAKATWNQNVLKVSENNPVSGAIILKLTLLNPTATANELSL